MFIPSNRDWVLCLCRAVVLRFEGSNNAQGQGNTHRDSSLVYGPQGFFCVKYPYEIKQGS